MSKKGSPLDSLSRRKLPKLDEIESRQDELEKDPTRASNVTLRESQWNWIDDKQREIQREGWRGVNKSSVLRAVIEVAMSSEVDLAGATTEEEIVQRLSRAMTQQT